MHRICEAGVATPCDPRRSKPIRQRDAGFAGSEAN
jgi:hypothetical protein